MNPVAAQLNSAGGIPHQLRALRRTAGLSGVNLALEAGWAQSKVSRLETGRQMPTATDIDTWVRLCNGENHVTRALIEQLDTVEAVNLDFRRSLRRGHAGVQNNYNRLVAEAHRVCHFETAYMPGLLQLPEYATRVIAEGLEMHAVEVDEVALAVALRMQRQQHLYNPSKRFEFLLTEAVLRWRLLPADQHAAQLDRLHTVVGLPNVRFGILPFDTMLPVTPQNSFQIYDDVVIIETVIGETTYRGAEFEKYALHLERLWEYAAEGPAARRLIAAASPS